MSRIQTIDGEISRLQLQAAAIEQAGPTFDETWPQVERALAEAEAIFRRHGAHLSGAPAVLPEGVYQRHQALVGACLVANGKAVRDCERARIKAATEGGISAADKQQRLAELRAAILRAAARRELAVREIEPEGEFQPRPVHAELAIYKRADVERLAH